MNEKRNPFIIKLTYPERAVTGCGMLSPLSVAMSGLLYELPS